MEIDPDTTTLRVSEVFWAPQGEGARSGEMSAFIRLQGCSAKHACYASGVVCDTEFESGEATSLAGLLAKVQGMIRLESGASHSSKDTQVEITKAPDSPLWIIWTGGEPLDQLTPEIVDWFHEAGFRQAIETSGIHEFPRSFREHFDWIVCSPKVAEHVLTKHFGVPGLTMHTEADFDPGTPSSLYHVHELRYVRHTGQSVPQPSLKALTRYISPHSDGFTLNPQNIAHVVKMISANPQWRISLQMHKAWMTL